MEIIFTEFIFAYSLAKCHKKVATIIFYFARAVSHAAVRTDRLCYNTSALPPPLPYNGLIFLKLRSGRLHWKRAFKKSAGSQGFWAGSERYTLRAISEANINFLACFFFKHKLHLILPKIMQKNSEIG